MSMAGISLMNLSFPEKCESSCGDVYGAIGPYGFEISRTPA
jgi:hypothetical protein